MSDIIGTFRPRSVRDAASIERDGDRVVALSRLSGGQDEVMFEDGTWLLCRADEDVTPSFYVDTDPGRRFEAVRYGERWNGWDTPVVTGDTLVELLAATGERYELVTAEDGVGFLLDGDAAPLVPGDDGLYDLRHLGRALLATEW